MYNHSTPPAVIRPWNDWDRAVMSNNRMAMLDFIIKECKRIELEKQKEFEKQEQAKREQIEKEEKILSYMGVRNFDRGGNVALGKRRVVCHITYYTNKNDRLQGGKYDKKGVLLTNHPMPIVALPKDIPYGAVLELDQPIKLKSGEATMFKNVDTGGAITWLNDEKTEMKVDVFIPNVSINWIVKNLDNKILLGTIYY